MKTNLRSMIDDALDGNMAREQHYGYHSPEPAYDASVSDVGVYKLAQALNYVSSNLNDLGTTDEKLAELALLQEKLASGTTTPTPTSTPDPAGAVGGAVEATGDVAKGTGTFGDSWSALKTEGMGKAWDKLSTGRKWVAGAGAGLVGLGALYGGYKLLSGGDNGNRTTVIKNASFSPLDEARSRAIINLADQYGLSQWDYMDKIAASAAILNLLGGTSSAALGGTVTKMPDGTFQVASGKKSGVKQVFKTQAEADAFVASRKAERGKALAKLVDPTKLDAANKAIYDKVVAGDALLPAERSAFETHLAGNRAALKDATKTRVNARTGQVARTGRSTVAPLRNMADIEIVDPADANKKIKYRVDTSKKLPGGKPITADALQAEANRLHAARGSTANLFGGKATVARTDLAAETVSAARTQQVFEQMGRGDRASAKAQAKAFASDPRVQQGYADAMQAATGTAPTSIDGRQLVKRRRAIQPMNAEKLFGNAVPPSFKQSFDAMSSATKIQVLQDMQRGTLDRSMMSEIHRHSKLTPAEVQSLGAGALGNYKKTLTRAGTQNNPAQTQYYARGSAQRPKGPARTAPGTAPTPRAVVPPKATAPVPTTPAPGATGATGAAGGAAGEAAADSAGFFSRNRRALLTAGGIGAAGLAGYGLYRALNRGGNTYEPSPEPAPQASYGGGYDGGYKTASLRKLAEDRINPARIVAGKAAPFSGFDIHGQPCDPPVIENPVALRAQAVRAMINKSMNNYVSNTGDGYDLNRYLGHFNK
ncbi:MAG: hypothetical protein ACO32I_02735 [Candidatus Limnocylindrus sp.]